VEQENRTRTVVIAALVVVALIVAFMILRGGSSYQVHARFADAGQLVKGGLVEVGGRTVGTVKEISLSDNNQADVLLNITDGDYSPLHRGTRAVIRSVGLSGVANRFVELHPGPEQRPEIDDGGTLSSQETQQIVDLDQLLTDFDPETRKNLQGLIARGADIYAGDGEARSANRVIQYLNPGIAQTRALASELVRDEQAFERLITTSSKVVTALASRRGDVEQGVANTAATLQEVAGERAAFEDLLGRAAPVLTRSRSTLRALRGTLASVNPALREAQPVARPLAQVLRALVPAARNATPALAQTRTLLDPLRRSLLLLPPLTAAGVPALNSAKAAIAATRPITEGLEPYTPDIIGGFLNGFGGTTGSYYDANGHYIRIAPVASQSSANGLLSLLPGAQTPTLANRTGLTARCAGAASEPADDKSNPFVPDSSVCNPDHSHRG
jgi:phospholipid/cholesterol/gamma-HCH transport system substrate-binding protein